MSRMKEHLLHTQARYGQLQRMEIEAELHHIRPEAPPEPQSLSESLLERVERLEHDMNMENIHNNKILASIRESVMKIEGHVHNIQEANHDA